MHRFISRLLKSGLRLELLASCGDQDTDGNTSNAGRPPGLAIAAVDAKPPAASLEFGGDANFFKLSGPPGRNRWRSA